MKNKHWTKEETILALALYCKIPFGKINHYNKQVKDLAHLIGRTPSAVSMKMCNFGRFDPALMARGVVGLAHGSRLDKEVWDEYYQNMEELIEQTSVFDGASEVIIPDEELQLPIGETRMTLSKSRKGQAFFRSTVLSAYNNTCCITGMAIPSLLQACHIKAWSESDPVTERTNPINGLSLNKLHHAAFDEGILTIDTDYRILISKTAKDRYSNDAFRENFIKYEGKTIILPERFLPSKEMIEYHNSKLTDF